MKTHDAFTNMAIDEAILTARIEGLIPDTLRLYRWKPSAVSIGRFQKMESEAYVKNCAREGVDIVRRITGGGAVYHDAESEITYCVVARKENLGDDISEVYAKICSGLARALTCLGVTADFNVGNAKACPNLTVKGRKISGSAQCNKRGVVLQHGTILVDVNIKKMFSCLRVPWIESCVEAAELARRKITSLRDELGKTISTTEMCQALTDGFQKALNIRLVDEELTSFESEVANKLLVEKYVTADWKILGQSSD